jgi:hypothetical protein
MTIKYGLHFFFELTDNDGQNFVAGIVPMVTLSFQLPVHKLSVHKIYSRVKNGLLPRI